MFDFSLLKTINLSDKNNLLFLSVSIISAVIVIFIIFAIILEIFKLIRKIINKFFIRIFGLNIFLKKNDGREVSVKDNKGQKKESQQSMEVVPKLTIDIAGGHKKDSLEHKEKDSFKLKDGVESKEEENKEEVKIPVPGRMKDLSELKPVWGPQGKENKIVNEEIKIPTAKSFSNIEGGINSVSEANGQKEIGALGIKNLGKNQGNTIQDDSIFGGKNEVSRENLEYQMANKASVWQTEVKEGLSLTPIERAKLIKEVLPQYLGSNISKQDLKTGIRLLNKKLSNTSDSVAHEKIRKEIKFFKKIGGIK